MNEENVKEIIKEPILDDPRTAHRDLIDNQDDLNLVKSKTEDTGWYLTEDIQGVGEQPEYFHPKTFKTIADQAKAYSKARSRIDELSDKLEKRGEIPDKYEISIKDELKNFKMDEELVEKSIPQLKEWAKNNQLSNKTFNSALNFFVEYLKNKETTENEKLEQYNKDELLKIDPNEAEAKRKLKELGIWMLQRYPTLERDTIKNMMISADAYNVLSHIHESGHITPTPISPQKIQYKTKAYLTKRMGLDTPYGKDKEYTDIVNNEWQEWGRRNKI